MPSRSDEGERLLRTVRVLTAGVKMINRLLNRRVLCCASLLLALSATAGHAQDTAPPMRASAVYACRARARRRRLLDNRQLLE